LPDYVGDTPLIHVAETRNARTLKLVLRYEPDLQARNQEGQTALHIAAIAQNCQKVRLLLRAGADVHAVDDDHVTPLGCVLDREFPDIKCIKRLLHHGADTKRVRGGTSAIEVAREWAGRADGSQNKHWENIIQRLEKKERQNGKAKNEA